MPTIEVPEEGNPVEKQTSENAEDLQVINKSPKGSPKKTPANAAKTSQSAPAKAKASKKPEPNLLNDFLRGRPSTSRPATTKPRGKSSGMAHAPVKTGAVQRRGQPSKVHNRVLQWQKANAAAGEPETTTAEELAPEHEEDDKEKPPARAKSAGPARPARQATPLTTEKDKKKPEASALVSKDKLAAPRKTSKNGLDSSMPPITRGAPMKRVVSDSNWMKRGSKKAEETQPIPLLKVLFDPGSVRKSIPAKSPAAKLPLPKALSKDLVETNAMNPPLSRKIHGWAKRTAEESRVGDGSQVVVVEEEDGTKIQIDLKAKMSSSPAKDGSAIDASAAEREAVIKARKEREEAGRVRLTRRKLGENGTSLSPRPEEIISRTRREQTTPRRYHDDLARRFPTRDSPSEKQRKASLQGLGLTPVQERRARYMDAATRSRSEKGESIDRPLSASSKSVSRGSAGPLASCMSSKAYMPDQTRSPSPMRREVRYKVRQGDRASRERDTKSLATGLSSLTSDSESTLSGPGSDQLSRRRTQSRKQPDGEKSLEEIPVGYSAFSVLDLSTAGHARSRPVKPQRKSSIVAVPRVLKNVFNEGMKIMQDTVDPPRIVIKEPRNIESWLNGTTDPFLDDPSKLPAVSQSKPRTQERPHRTESKSCKSNHSEDDLSYKETPGRNPLRSGSSRQHARQILEDYSQPRRTSHDDLILQEVNNRERIHESVARLKRRPAKRENSSLVTRGHSGKEPGPKLQNVDLVDKDECTLATNSVTSQTAHKTSKETRRDEAQAEEIRRQHSPYHVNQDTHRPPSSAKKSDNDDADGRGSIQRQNLETSITEATPRALDRRDAQRPSRYREASRRSENDRRRDGSVAPIQVWDLPGLKRRLTKHSDLMSVLSLPDTSLPQRGASIVSARSLRTRRAPLADRNVTMILAEVAADEIKYTRDLTTLVDGVIPVLISSVLSRTGSLVGGKSSQDIMNPTIKKPIVDMGIALEKLKNGHSQGRLEDADGLACWLLSIHETYDEYLSAWRMGFDDVVVNLAPVNSSRVCHGSTKDTPAKDTESVDVAYLLRRPLVRVKYLARAAKGLSLASDFREAKLADEKFERLMEKMRLRTKEENARKQDLLADNTNTTRARDLRALSTARDVQINQTRQVKAKEYFDLDLQHSNGQYLSCEVEIIVRDSSRADDGDVLICEIDDGNNHWLLFAPVEIGLISARRGKSAEDLVVMVRGFHGGKEWVELMSLRAENADIAEEFISMLGSKPVPPSLSYLSSRPFGAITPENPVMSGGLLYDDRSQEPFGGAGDKDAHAKQSPDGIGQFIETVDHVWQNDVQPNGTSSRFRSADDKHGPSSRISKPMAATPSSSPRGTLRSDLTRSLQKHRVSSPIQAETCAGEAARPQSSSPLKREYQPFQSSAATGSSEYTSDSYDSESSHISSHEESDTEITSQDVNSTNPSSLFSAAAAVVPAHQKQYCVKFLAHLSCWRQSQGRYDDLHSEICSVVVRPGFMEIFVLDAPHSWPANSNQNELDTRQPLVSLILTPVTLLRRSNGLDIEIHSQPLAISLLKASPIIRLRSRTNHDCMALFGATHKARLDNLEYHRIQQERIVNNYGKQLEPDTERKPFGWFGRKKSYRASARAPTVSESGGSAFSSASAFMKRFSRGGAFNIDRSTMRYGNNRSPSDSRGSSSYGMGDSGSLGYSPPHTAYDPSNATTGTIDTSQFDSSNLRVRVYILTSTKRQWAEVCLCRLQIETPPPGTRQNSFMGGGIQRRILLTQATEESTTDRISKRFSLGNGVSKSKNNKKESTVLIDQVMGSKSFIKASRVGIVMVVWEDMRGPNGELGMAPATGGVTGRQTKWMLQCENAAQARWIFGMLGGGV